MLETIIPSSSGGTTRRIRFSTRATSSSVTEILVPLGALRLITNWPASVRGKNDRPRRGKMARVARNEAAPRNNVNFGHRSAAAAPRSYHFKKDSKRSLNQTLNRSPKRQRFCLLFSSTSTGSSEDGVP